MASSESDADEFYDAEEATPVRRGKQSGISFGHQDSIGSLCSAGSDTSESQIPIQDLEEEEKKLLEQKRLADERRQREDEELRKRLEDLEAKKKKELEARKKKEAERLEVMRKAEEQEERRRKLQEMRDSMMEEGTPAQGGPPKPPRTYMHEEDMAMEDGAEGGADTDVEEESILDISGEKNALSQHSGDNIHEKSMDHNVLGDVEDNEEGDINLNTPTVEEEKVASKHLTALMSSTEDQQCSSDSKDDVFVDSDDTVTKDNTKLQSQQPDIVQSTKPRPSDLPPPRPVAPPRRKRTNKGPPPPRPPPPSSASQVGGAEAAGRERGMSQSTQSEVKGLPLELPTPTSTILSLTKDLEQSLDLHSATSGTRLVTAAEEVSNKADLTEEERKRQSKTKDEAKPVQKEEMVGPVKPKSAEDGTLVGDEQKEEVKRKEEDSKEDGSVPESTQFTFRGTMRPRSNSGSRYLTDVEILDMVTVLNLDTGETVPLSLAEDKLPKCVNPLSLHIMRRTKEYSSDSSLHKNAASDEDDGKPSPGTKTIRSVKPRFKTRKIKKFLGKTVNKLKSVADEVLHGEGAGADNSSEEEDESLEGRRMIKGAMIKGLETELGPGLARLGKSATDLSTQARVEIKASSHHKGPYDFDLLVPVQDLLGEHSGAIWTMKWSQCGRLLATGGQDNLLRVWVLREHYSYFDDMRRKYSKSKVSPAPSQDSLNSQSSENSSHSEESDPNKVASSIDDAEVDEHAPFMSKPFCIYKGHTADLLDLSWSKNYFILSSSMDKTVRLWHISRKECLCCFQHIDFVTAIAFHPRDDRYFLSGSLDGKLRLWNIPDKKVALWNEVLGTTKLITAANFCLNGRFAVVGTYDGRCIFYSTEHLKYYTQIHVRSTRGRNARGRKVTGIEPVPGEDKILVTSNDSRIRLYDLRDLTLTSKYKGCANNSSQIKASFSANGKYIICGSEDHFVYIWRTQHEFYKYTSARRDRNDFWEGIKAHSAVVTVAMFAPNPGLIIKPQFQFMDSENKEVPEVRGEVLVSADFSGAIKVFINKFKPGSG